MVRQMSEKGRHPGTTLYVHVDDISNIIKAVSQQELCKKAIKWAKGFRRWTDELQLDISDKSVVVPVCKAARAFTKLAQAAHIPVRMDKQGGDIGVDTSSGATRTTKKQKERIRACVKQARRACFLARRRKKARRLAMTAIKPAQLYGHTAVGMSPSNINDCKANITEATGMAGANACSTSLLSWAFRKK